MQNLINYDIHVQSLAVFQPKMAIALDHGFAYIYHLSRAPTQVERGRCYSEGHIYNKAYLFITYYHHRSIMCINLRFSVCVVLYEM